MNNIIFINSIPWKQIIFFKIIRFWYGDKSYYSIFFNSISIPWYPNGCSCKAEILYYIYELDIFNQDCNTLKYNIYYYFYKLSKLFIQKFWNPKNLRTFEAQQMMVEIQDRTPNRFHVNTTSPAFFSKTNIVFDASIAATLTRLSQQG